MKSFASAEWRAAQARRAYFCVRGGFQTDRVLDSRSSLSPLPRGAELPCPANTIASRFLAGLGKLDWDDNSPIRVLPGTQARLVPGR